MNQQQKRRQDELLGIMRALGPLGDPLPPGRKIPPIVPLSPSERALVDKAIADHGELRGSA
jgi:hypothetical protein